jgi:hypothetical protein
MSLLYSSLSWIEWFERLDRVLSGAREDIRRLAGSSGARGFAALERTKRQLCVLTNDLTLLDREVISHSADGLQKALDATVSQLGAAASLPPTCSSAIRHRALAAIDAALRDSGYEAAHLLSPQRRRA